ncbi:uncharacterized protein LDX57_004127 [Aspergillus melleus]|uniref:uncharacterized protein n=1 Tax=Aspergillus melleus TaxID=138277 RepID=UPI001E8D3FC1|nr:uncharacterized protein LDX57_004127 [Aspergillus melleus]KAH8426389.1 hypothetical protein LDX57_004127 [Aspergillus melleus]
MAAGNHGPTDKTAQEFYPVQWRIHVGNLPDDMGEEQLIRELREVFKGLLCYIKPFIHQPHSTAFVQFTELAHWKRALGYKRCTVGNRVLRIEPATGRRDTPPSFIWEEKEGEKMKVWKGPQQQHYQQHYQRYCQPHYQKHYMQQYLQQYTQQDPHQYPEQYPEQYPHQYPVQYPQQYPVQYPHHYPQQYLQQYPHQYPHQYPQWYPQW